MIKKNNKNRGFTLVELLVVISIMGIMTVIVASNFTEAQKKARDAKRKGDLASISKALYLFYNDYGKFPSGPDNPSIEGLVTNGGDFVVESDVYMKQVPTEKTSGIKPYTYVTKDVNGKSFRLWTNLENDKDKDCIPMGTDNPDDYSVDVGCMYAVYSSNIGVTTPLL